MEKKESRFEVQGPARGPSRDPRRPAQQRWRRWLARLATAGVSLAVLLALGVWILRDLPRRQLERALSERLEADVSIAELQLRPQIVLSGVTIRRMRSLPALEAASTSRIVVHGQWRALLSGEIERLEIAETRARLQPVCGRPLELPSPRARIDRVDLASLRLEVAAGERRADLHLAGSLQRAGRGEGGLGGTLAVSAPAIDLLALAALWRPELSPLCGGDEDWPPLRVEQVSGELVVDRGARPPESERGDAELRISTRLVAARVSSELGGHAVVLLEPTLEGTLRLASTTTLEASARARGLERAVFDLELGPDDLPPSWRASVSGLELEPWLPLAGALGIPGELSGAGALDVELESPRTPPGAPAPGAATTGAAWTFRATAELERLDATGLDGPWSAVHAGGIRIDVDGRPAQPPPVAASASAAASAPALAAVSTSPSASGKAGDHRSDPGGAPLTLEAGLRMSLARFSAEPSRGRADADGPVGFQPAGFQPADLSWLAPLSLAWQGTVSRRRIDGSARLELTSPDSALGSLQVRGSFEPPAESGDGAASGGRVDVTWTWSGNRLDRLAGGWREHGGAWPPDLVVLGSARASGRVRGPLAAPSLTARIDLDAPSAAGRLGGQPLAVDAASLTLALESSAAGGLGARFVDPVPVRLAFDDHPPIAASVALDGLRWEWDGERAALERLEIDASEPRGRLLLSDVELTGAGRERRAEGSLELTGAGVPALVEWWTGDQAAEGRGALQGTASAALRWAWQAGGAWSAEGRAAIDGGGWSSADGSRAIVAFEPRLALSAASTGEGIEARAAGALGGVQVLWDALFFDYSGRFAELDASIRVSSSPEAQAQAPEPVERSPDSGDPDSRETASPSRREPSAIGALLEGRTLRGDVHLAGTGFDARWRGTQRAAGEPEMALTLELDDLGAAWRTWVSEPLAGSGTRAERIGLGGSARADLTGTREGETWRIAGEAHTTAVAATLGEDVEIVGLGLELPIDLAVRVGPGGIWGGTRDRVAGGMRVEPPDPDAPALVGALRFARLRAGGVEVTPVDAALSVRGDGLALRDRLRVPLFAGVVELDTLSIRGLLGGSPALEADVSIAGLDLRQATDALGVFPLEGAIDAHFPLVRLQDGRLETEGTGVVRIFGGRAEVTELAGSDLFGSFPRLALSARLEEIDLSELTRTLEFGEITGLARGELRNLELVGGSPVRFQGQLRTIPVARVERRVSIRAIDNIARLGTGADLGFLQRGIRRLFDSYPYQSLGIDLALERDDFVLRGLERRGDRELFLKGRWPLRLDIVNVKPGTRVSFSTMMRRIGNLEIQREGARPPSEQRSNP